MVNKYKLQKCCNWGKINAALNPVHKSKQNKTTLNNNRFETTGSKCNEIQYSIQINIQIDIKLNKMALIK